MTNNSLSSSKHYQTIMIQSIKPSSLKHLPINNSFNDPDRLPPRYTRTFTNFRRADWPKFRQHVETALESIPPPTSCAAGEKTLRDILLEADRKFALLVFARNTINCSHERRLTCKNAVTKSASLIHPKLA